MAAESAYFLLAFVNIGLVPDGGSTAFLPARVGYARAAEMAMLGERVPADQALDWGLINRVVADDELEADAGALLERLANGPTASYAGSKQLLNRRIYADLAGQLDAEAEAQRDQGQSRTSSRASSPSWRSGSPTSPVRDGRVRVSATRLGFGPMPSWDDVVAIGERLPGVETGTWYGTRGLLVAGKGFCRLRTDPDALVLRVAGLDEKEALLQGDPKAFFTTPHYDGSPHILIRLEVGCRRLLR